MWHRFCFAEAASAALTCGAGVDDDGGGTGGEAAFSLFIAMVSADATPADSPTTAIHLSAAPAR
ncbi:hypothetical protein DFS55_25390 (plasmid) [Mycobacterium avium subsp. hominissuis]|uniref:Uncharacterized protein n=1 Tax=Mycobacterium avium subsp. hominissuis TaxID=439334 RepID=A0A3B6XFD8_MYCAV|nr:hypothetical protein DFS55_25390 [Mycobacterium avium subsp. hominissuis]